MRQRVLFVTKGASDVTEEVAVQVKEVSEMYNPTRGSRIQQLALSFNLTEISNRLKRFFCAWKFQNHGEQC